MEIFHIYNRGVEKRKIFMNDADRFRFVTDLTIFNDVAPALNLGRSFLDKMNEVQLQSRKRLVRILAFCLMPNHYHLMIQEITENGMTEFMRKLGTGYTNYFNLKYKRVGSLFQGRYKSILIKNEAHFIHLPYYIHCNPLDLFDAQWREQQIKNIKKADQFLESYKWSSYHDYIGKKNFPEVTDRDFLNNYFQTPAQYKKDTLQWIKGNNVNDLKEILFES